MPEFSKDAYTLLADDNLDISQDVENLRRLKAHIVLSVLTNSSLMFSDNQIVNSANLSALLASDDAVRELVRQKVLHFALRRQQGDDTVDAHERLLNTHRAFVQERKSKLLRRQELPNEDFALISRYGVVVDWHYENVRSNYTRLCKKTLLSEIGRRAIGDTKFDLFQTLIEQEEASNQGLGRIFVQRGLFESMAQYGQSLDQASMDFVKHATEAPYLSNLPQILKRNPIYEPQHQPSFELVRNIKYDFIDIEAPRKVATRLDTRHFIEGLARLSADEIMRLREDISYRTYIRLCGDESLNANDLDELRLCLEELAVSIDDYIYSKFPDLHATNCTTSMELRTRISRVNFGIGLITDVVGFFFSMPILINSFTIGTIIDLVRKKGGADDEALRRKDIANARLLHRAIESKLSEGGANPYIKVEDVLTTESHDIETVVQA